jgi:hypothetical protein
MMNTRGGRKKAGRFLERRRREAREIVVSCEAEGGELYGGGGPARRCGVGGAALKSPGYQMSKDRLQH